MQSLTFGLKLPQLMTLSIVSKYSNTTANTLWGTDGCITSCEWSAQSGGTSSAISRAPSSSWQTQLHFYRLLEYSMGLTMASHVNVNTLGASYRIRHRSRATSSATSPWGHSWISPPEVKEILGKLPLKTPSCGSWRFPSTSASRPPLSRSQSFP